jgi:hypothetical protein
MNSRFVKIAAAVTVVAALALGGAAWAIAGGGDDDGASATGPAADKARAAALAHFGGGTASEVESEGGAWEVEVTKRDGSKVEVVLDQNYRVVGTDSENESNESNDND